MKRIAGGLFTLNAVIWLGLGVASVLRIGAENPLPVAVQWVIAVLMFANAGAMLAAGEGIRRRKQPFYWFGVALLLVNILLTVTDEFGFLDLVTLLLDLVLLGPLLVKRAEILAPERVGG